MATRMQQRRGTAEQWTAANPILAAGEIGFETDTNKFKIGNGSSTWSNITYFTNASELALLLDGAPDALNTLNELAAAIGDDADFFTTVGQNLAAHTNASTMVHGIADTSVLATTGDVDDAATAAGVALSAHATDTTLIHGIADTSLLATTSDVDDAITAADSALGIHAGLTENVHGILDTSVLVTQTELADAITNSTVDQEDLAGVGLDWNAEDERFDIDSTVATKTYADDAVTAHNDLTENVHGIANTADLATESYADTAVSTAVGALTKSSVGLANVDNTSDADKPVSDDTQDALDLKAPKADPTFTGTVSGVTKTHVGLGNVDNTSDANKPVSTATQTALDAKAPIAAPSFTGNANFESNVTIEGNLVVEGTTTTVNTSEVQIDDPIFYLSANQYDANTRDIGITGAYGTVGGDEEDHLHTGLVKDVTDGKWKLFSNAPHPVNNVVDFTSAAYDTLKVGPLEATTVTPSSGVVFSDGTQTKEGTPSRTYIYGATNSNAKTAQYTLSSLAERDSLIEVSHTGGTAIKILIPTDANLNYPIGTSIDILQTNTGGVTIEAVTPGTTAVNATPGSTLRTQWSSATLFKRGANAWVVYGDLK
jgi:hypothetical protein